MTNGALAYDTRPGESYTLILNQVLDFRDTMGHLLLSTNQAIHNNIAIHDAHPSIDYHNRSTYDIFFPETKKYVKISHTNKAISHVQVTYSIDDYMKKSHNHELTSSKDWNSFSEDWNPNLISSTSTEKKL